MREYRARYPAKIKARHKVFVELRAGRLQKPKQCSRCRKRKRLEADHHDYSKPLDIQWLCRQCHTDVEVERRDAARIVYKGPRLYVDNTKHLYQP